MRRLLEPPPRTHAPSSARARASCTGIKYAANMWVHQFSFKTPSERGCELTYVNTMGRQPSTPQHRELVGSGRVPTTEETIKMAAEQGLASA